MMSGGSLEGNHKMLESKISHITYQVLYALKYLHEKNIVHRDIKAENVMLTYPLEKTRHDCDIQCKLADFGLSGLLDPLSDGLKDFVGTDDHMAPEIVTLANNPEFNGEHARVYKHHIRSNGTYNDKVDIWALGCMVYEMFCGTTPFDDGGSCL
jgi:serine/threonine protein kinase